MGVGQRKFFFCEIEGPFKPTYGDWAKEIIAHCKANIDEKDAPYQLAFFFRESGKLGCIIHYAKNKTPKPNFTAGNSKGPIEYYVPHIKTLAQALYNKWKQEKDEGITYFIGELNDQAIIDESLKPIQVIFDHQTQKLNSKRPGRDEMIEEIQEGQDPSKMIYTSLNQAVKLKQQTTSGDVSILEVYLSSFSSF